jgi:cell division transport system permease protein
VRANFVLSGVATGIRRNMTMTIALVLSTAIALAFVGAAILAELEISKFKHAYEGNLNVSVYLCSPTLKGQEPVKVGPCAGVLTQPKFVQQRDALRAKLAADPMVSSVKYVSQEEAVKRYDETVSKDVAKLTQVGDLPASFTVKLKDIRKDFDPFVKKYQNEPGVAQTENASNVLKTLLRMIDGARFFSIIIAVVVLVASILLIANTIQVAAAQRKNETSIMRLVGASRWMTELPFMLETVVAAAIGGLIAMLLIAVGKQYVLNSIFAGPVRTGVIPDLSTNDVLVAGGLGLVSGAVLAAMTAFATLRLYVKL